LTGSKDYIHRTLDTITNSRSKRWYNPDYKFPLERLEDFEQAIRELLGYKAQKCLDLMSTYKAFNPDLNYWHPKDYSIKNPTFFDEMDSPVKAYWYGFLCADGWIYSNRPRIGLEQAIKDKDSVVKFVEVLGLDKSRIEERTGFYRYKGKIKTFKSARITFSSKKIADVLKGYGFSDLKTGRYGLPNFVKSLISQAKQEALQIGVHWSETYSGKIAFGWLLGFYDGDGTYIGVRQARISSTNKKLLDDIKIYFEVQNLVYISKSLDESLDEGYWKSTKPLYSLNLGPDVFVSMINSYKGSMVRKRPSNPTSNFLGDYA